MKEKKKIYSNMVSFQHKNSVIREYTVEQSKRTWNVINFSLKIDGVNVNTV